MTAIRLVARAALSFLPGLPRQLYAALGAVLALLLAWHVHTGWERAAYNEAFNAGYNALRPAYEKQRQSIKTLTDVLDIKNKESQSRADEYNAVKSGDAADQGELARLRKESAGRLKVLEAIRKQAVAHPGTKVPDTLLAQLEGL